MKRIVLDTNVIISALFWKGYPRMVYNLANSGKVTMLFSKQIEAEFIRVLCYPRFGLNPSEILPLVNNLRRRSHYVEQKSNINVIRTDPTDNIFLECAVDGKADYIISGDHHLLDMDNYEGVQIVTAKDFLLKEGFI